jgi:hypothetical protein
MGGRASNGGDDHDDEGRQTKLVVYVGLRRRQGGRQPER